MRNKLHIATFLLIATVAGFLAAPAALGEPPTRDAILATMQRATDFAFNTLANRGGFVWLYTMELEPYGELKARPSMIWVEPPSTPSVGIMLLDAHRATGDAYYLEQARKVAEALAWGQHPSGGWHYFIDFDPAGVENYYDTFFTKCWGWQEYLKKRKNCTFDDYTTTEPTRFFLRLYDTTKDPAHKAVLDKALGHILRAQYANGGWPQRYPIDPEHPDYSACATLNDDVTLDCILVLLEAHERLGNAEYLAAARNGMDFYVRAQLPAPQAGWAQQYDADLKPAWGRPFEIATVCAPQTHTCVLDLFRFYAITGDKKYLEPVPKALEWLDSARVPGAEGFTHTCYNETGTNRPIYILQTGTTVDDVAYTPTYEEKGCYPYSPRLTIPVDDLRKEYERLAALSPEAAREEGFRNEHSKELPQYLRGIHMVKALSLTQQTPEGLAAIVESLDERGGWRDEVSLLDPFQPFTKPPRVVTAYTIGGYIARMDRLINELNAQNAAEK
ncbi:MAG: pectate lyase [Candidatus Hydrogenedentales bacterium]|jgi:hypothetical protein